MSSPSSTVRPANHRAGAGRVDPEKFGDLLREDPVPIPLRVEYREGWGLGLLTNLLLILLLLSIAFDCAPTALLSRALDCCHVVATALRGLFLVLSS